MSVIASNSQSSVDGLFAQNATIADLAANHKEENYSNRSIDEILQEAEKRFQLQQLQLLEKEASSSPSPLQNDSLNDLLNNVKDLLQAKNLDEFILSTPENTSSSKSTSEITEHEEPNLFHSSSSEIIAPNADDFVEDYEEVAKVQDAQEAQEAQNFQDAQDAQDTQDAQDAQDVKEAQEHIVETVDELEVEDTGLEELEDIETEKKLDTITDNTVCVKAFYKDDVRRIMFDTTSGYQKLLESMKKIYPFEPMIKYRDDECELITIGCDDDLKESLRILYKTMQEEAVASGRTASVDVGCIPTLRVYIFKGEKKKKKKKSEKEKDKEKYGSVSKSKCSSIKAKDSISERKERRERREDKEKSLDRKARRPRSHSTSSSPSSTTEKIVSNVSSHRRTSSETKSASITEKLLAKKLARGTDSGSCKFDLVQKSSSRGATLKKKCSERSVKLPPSTRYEQIWRIKNTSNETWNEKTRLTFIKCATINDDGEEEDLDKITIDDNTEIKTNEANISSFIEEMKKEKEVLLRRRRIIAPSVIEFGVPVHPGNEVEMRINIISPQEPGEYIGYWKVTDAEGNRLTSLLYVKIQVTLDALPSSSSGSGLAKLAPSTSPASTSGPNLSKLTSNTSARSTSSGSNLSKLTSPTASLPKLGAPAIAPSSKISPTPSPNTSGSNLSKFSKSLKSSTTPMPGFAPSAPFSYLANPTDAKLISKKSFANANAPTPPLNRTPSK